MERPLRVLVVEDSPDDAELMILALRRDGFDPIWERVETAEDLKAALAKWTWDAVLSDFSLPEFRAAAALEVVRAVDRDLPFLVVSGSVGNEVAAGANDYVLKQNLTRLAPALDRELREADNRRVRRLAERTAAHLAAVVESSDDAIISMTIDGAIMSWNPAAETLYGWRASEAVGRNVSFLVPPDKDDELARLLGRLRAGERVEHFETVRLHQDGRRIDVSLILSAVRDAAGRLVGVSKIAHDIGERKQAEDALRRSEARYRGLIESIPALVWVFDTAGQQVLHNRRWYEYTGKSPEEAKSDEWHHVLHTDDAAAAIAHWERCKAGGDPYEYEFRLRRADGAYRWFLCKKTALRGPGGIEHWVGICIDIDDRKRAEAEFRRTANLLMAVAEGTPDGVFVKDRDSRYLLCNPAAARFMGRLPASVLGRTDAEFYDPASMRYIVDRDRRVMETEQTETEEEELTANGVTRTFLITRAPYRDTAANVIGVIGISRDITDRKFADESLAFSETRYRRLFEAAQDGILIVDAVTRRVFDANPFMTDLLGYSREELIGKELWEIGLFQDIAANQEAFRELQEQGYIRYDDRPLSAKGGGRIEVEFVSNLYDVGNTRVIHCNIRDVTDRQHLANERDELLARLQLHIERMPLAYILFDADLHISDWNPAAEWILGYTREEALGMSPFALIPSSFRPEASQILARVRTGDMTVYSVNENLAKDGRTITCEWYNTPLMSEAGQFIGLLCLAQDITERRAAEAALQSRDRAIQAVTQGILITDPNRRDNPITYASPGFLRLTGYAVEEVLGRNCRFLQGKDTDPASVARVRDAVQAGQFRTVELLNYRKDGTAFWNELSISPVRDEAGQLTHFVGIQADVTVRRNLEEQLRQVQKMEAVGQLAGGVAHDFNNLLTIINGYSDLLLQDLPASDPSRDLVAEIHKAGERSAGLTRQLLAFSRQQVLAPRMLDLNAVVTDTDKLLRRLIGEDVRLTLTLDPLLWAVRSDPGQIEQVLMNLAVNAQDAMPKGGRLTIETRNVDLDEPYVRAHVDARAGPHVLLSMTDTGSGMPPEVKAKIFEPFFTTKGPGKGTGLGLATVYGIVKQSGGHVAVYSEVGVGTSFKVYLPQVERIPGGSKVRPGLMAPPRGTETILLAEDEDGVRALTRHVLAGCGYTVLEAFDGNEAVRMSAKYDGPIHLLITDVVMPGQGGRAAAEQIAKRHPELRVLFVSGYTDDAVIRHGVLGAGVNFLQKPFSPVALAFKVREVLDARDETGTGVR